MRTRILPWRLGLWVLLGALVAGGVIAVTGTAWLSEIAQVVSRGRALHEAEGAAGVDPQADGHDHAAHADDASIKLSAVALRNIGYQPLRIELGKFVKTATMPAMVVERPGRSQIQITAPLTGVVVKVVPTQGAAVEPGAPLFEVRLTYEELVTAQSNLIRTAESLEVVNREINRLQALGEGVVAGRRVLEQEYERQKLEASLRAERQALRLHGLSESDVESILRERKLFQTITVNAPPHTHEADDCRMDHVFHVRDLLVTVGQQVEAGQVLCVLADHCELYIEGRAFEDDAPRLRTAARGGWEITATLLVGERATDRIDGLKVLYLADNVDPLSRAFRFYLRLPNQVVLDQTTPGGVRFLDWRFKPGQRMELQVPIEEWDNRIVLPVEAAVEEGAETYLYRQNGDLFERVPVHVEYRDQWSVVIANDGAVYPGDIVAGHGAYQMHLELKNKSGGAIDPHAGHNH